MYVEHKLKIWGGLLKKKENLTDNTGISNKIPTNITNIYKFSGFCNVLNYQLSTF